MKKSFRLYYDGRDYIFNPNRQYRVGQAWVCASKLHLFFEFPKETSTIEIVLSDKAINSGSYLVQYEGFMECGSLFFIDSEDDLTAMVLEGVTKKIKPYFMAAPNNQLYVTLFTIS